jgi:folylpolyglutamate synthase/dihydropteroate synthase
LGISEEAWRQRYAHLPLYQRDNVATARAVVQWLQRKFSVLLQIWEQESSQFYWPCRWERFYNESAGEMILDGAHNLEGSQAILREIESHRANGTPFQQLIFGSIERDRARHMLALLVPHFEEIFLVVSGYERHLSEEDFHFCMPEGFETRIRMITLKQAGIFLAKKKKILITGSLYMLGGFLTSYRPLWKNF